MQDDHLRRFSQATMSIVCWTLQQLKKESCAHISVL
jgi:hypothetical protein